MKSSDNSSQSYFAKLGSFKTMIWVVALAVLAIYGIPSSDYDYDPSMGDPYGSPEEYGYSSSTDPYQQPMPATGQLTDQQPMPPTGQQAGQYPQNNMHQYPSGNQSRPVMQQPSVQQQPYRGYPRNNDYPTSSNQYPGTSSTTTPRSAPSNYGY